MKKTVAFLLSGLLLFSYCNAQILLVEEYNTISADTVITNQDTQNKDVNLVVAAYDENGRMLDVKTTSQSIKPGETKFLKARSGVFTGETSDFRFKAFLWNPFLSQQPWSTLADSEKEAEPKQFGVSSFDITASSGEWVLDGVFSYDEGQAYASQSDGCSADFAFPQNLSPGTYDVYLYRAANGTAQEQNVSATVNIVSADEEIQINVPFVDANSGWHRLGSYKFASGEQEKVVVSKNEGVIRPAAVLFKKTAAMEAKYSNLERIIPFQLENATGTWVSGSVPNHLGEGSYYANGVSSATFYAPNNFAVPENRVYLYRAVHENSTTAATVTVYAGENSYVQTVNFRQGESGWYDLGTFHFFNQPTDRITVQNSSGYIRPAAVMFQQKPQKISEAAGRTSAKAAFLEMDSAFVYPDEWGNFTVTVDVTDEFICHIKLSDLFALKASSPACIVTIQTKELLIELDLSMLDLEQIAALSDQNTNEAFLKIMIGDALGWRGMEEDIKSRGINPLTRPKSFAFFASKKLGFERLDLGNCAKGELTGAVDEKNSMIKISSGSYMHAPSQRQTIEYGKPNTLNFALEDADAYAMVDKNILLAPFENSDGFITTTEFSRILMQSQGKDSTIFGQANITLENAAVLLANQLVETGKHANTRLPDDQILRVFLDRANISGDKIQAVKKLTESYVIEGNGSTYLNPTQPITGRYAAELIYKFLNMPVWESPIKEGDWSVLFIDEFSDPINSNIWSFRYGERLGGLNRAENVFVSDGRMYIDFKKEKVNGVDWYTGGGIISKQFFGYGYYETRSKLYGETGGMHNSFWSMGFGGDGEIFPKDNQVYEIDGYEIDSNRPSRITMNLNMYIGKRTGNGNAPVDWLDTAKEDFILGYEWLPDRINWYVNGRLVQTKMDTQVPIHYAQQNLWITGLANTQISGIIDDLKLPGIASWDYVRFYARPLKNVNLLGAAEFEYNQNDGFENNRNLQNPVSWMEKGNIDASLIERREDAYGGNYVLAHRRGTPYQVTTSQRLYYIPNGNYELEAYVKSSGGQNTAKLRVSDFNGTKVMEKVIPQSQSEWIKVTIEGIDVTKNGAYVEIISDAEASQWLLIDNISFYTIDGNDGEPLARPFPY